MLAKSNVIYNSAPARALLCYNIQEEVPDSGGEDGDWQKRRCIIKELEQSLYLDYMMNMMLSSSCLAI